jgi:hypothetical protein
MKMGLYTKRPTPCRAFQWQGSQHEAEQIARFLGDLVPSRVGVEYARPDRPAHISLKTAVGLQNASPNDWFVEESEDNWFVVSNESFQRGYDEKMQLGNGPAK